MPPEPSRWGRPDDADGSLRAPADGALRELEASRRDVAVRGGWLLGGVVLGALVMLLVGVSTDLFHDEDDAARTAAFDAGFARGAEQAREDFEREIAVRETGAFARGQASVRDREEVIGLTIVQLLAAQEAGARSARAALAGDAAEAFAQGYADGYAAGYADAEAGNAPNAEPPGEE